MTVLPKALILALPALILVSRPAAASTVAEMRDARRVLLVSAPDGQDAALRTQRDELARGREDARSRDLSVVEIVGDTVSGASDRAAALRAAYGVSPGRFTVVLIGKDGGVKRRSAEPISMSSLNETIDAMPMGRAERLKRQQ
jgi:hypothetical protein